MCLSSKFCYTFGSFDCLSSVFCLLGHSHANPIFSNFDLGGGGGTTFIGHSTSVRPE